VTGTLYMPTPRKGEKRSAFVSRCVPIVIDEGTAKNPDQAVAICNSMWEDAKKELPMEQEVQAAPVQPETQEKEIKAGPTKDGTAIIATYIPWDAKSFEDVDEYMAAEETSARIKEVTRQFEQLTTNIMANPDINDKAAAMQQLVGELDARLEKAAKLKPKRWWEKMKEAILPKPEPDNKQGLLVWHDKEADVYRWFAVYSNNYKDEDHPPEIISAEAHRNFVKEVDDGVHPYPELRHWHIRGSRWGQADWLAFDEDTGMSLASGTVDAGHEKEAEAVMAMDEPPAVSHGMVGVEYDAKDASVINRYVSVELSDLPLSAAANKLTGFNILKEENTMGIPDDKKEYLRKAGLDEERIAGIEADLESKAAKAAEDGLEFKEGEQPAEAAAAPEEAQPEEAPEAADDTPEQPESNFATKSEVAEAIVAAVKPLTEAVEALTKQDEAKVAKKAADTPAASISHLVMKALSVTEADRTKVDGEGDEFETAKETAPTQHVVTGLSWLDSMLAEEQ
jgi:hypothetical protein